MSSKAVIRDVGRVLDLPYNFCDQLSKLIPVEAEQAPVAGQGHRAEPQLKARIDEEGGSPRSLRPRRAPRGPDAQRRHARRGRADRARQADRFLPAVLGRRRRLGPSSQYDKDDVEKVGLVKFDFLGLRNLTIIKLAVDYVERAQGGDQRPDLAALAFDDPQAYQILKDANTTAIFQVESEGMKKLLRSWRPTASRTSSPCWRCTVRARSARAWSTTSSCARRGSRRSTISTRSPACLEPTYGVIVYQEQVMQIAQIIGGYTLGAAPTCCAARWARRRPKKWPSTAT
jgi:DNA polymerase-3 subunit alpha